MYSGVQLAKKYVQYLITASNGSGHGIHSPFVFAFVTNVLRDKKRYSCYKPIEELRAQLLTNNTIIDVEDYGAGSSVISDNKRSIEKIAKSSLKNKKFSRLLFRIVQYYRPQNIIELGTSFGITTSYFAFGNPLASIYTMEGAKSIASLALNNFKKLHLKNVHLIEGNFDNTFPGLVKKITTVDLAFIDGNHRKISTMNYFHLLLENSADKSIFIFDDIHWSEEMEYAWRYIKEHPAVKLTIDLFFTGLVFFNKDFKVKQHFTIRF